MFDTKFAEIYITSVEMLGAGTDDEKITYSTIRSVSLEAFGYFADLVNAAKKKPITEKNVEGYLEMINASEIRAGPVTRFINDIRGYFPDMVHDDDFRDGLAQQKWTEYRLARVHAGLIIYEILEPLTQLGLISVAERKLVTHGRDMKHSVIENDKIPRRLVLLAAVYHIAAGTRIDGWIQGEREISRTPRAKVAAIRAMWTKFFTIQGGLAVIDAASDVEELKTIVAGKF
jgi:hypothetical protein